MTEQACRFTDGYSGNVGLRRTCLFHNAEQTNIICDLGLAALNAKVEEQMGVMEKTRDIALEEAALIADAHWPEEGHCHVEDAVSCQMSISILIRRRKSTYGKALSSDPPKET